jgi:hypothetical protein
MRFRIEIARESGGSTDVVYQATIDGMSVHRARIKAAADLYSGRGANSARVFNEKHEELYKLVIRNRSWPHYRRALGASWERLPIADAG